MEPILEMQHITYSYHTTEGETKALEDVSFSVSEGELLRLSVLPVVENQHFYLLFVES